MPAFCGDRMRGYYDVITDAVTDQIAELQPGDQVAVAAVSRAITLDVVIRVVFGVTDRSRREEYARVINALMASSTASLMLVPWLRREIAGRGPWARLVAFRAQLDRLLSAQMAERRGMGEHGSDMLGLILSATDEGGTPWVTTRFASSCARYWPPGMRRLRHRWPGRCTTSTATRASADGLSRNSRAWPQRTRWRPCPT